MEFPLYKEWMGEVTRTSQVYVQGVREFLKFVKRNLNDKIIPCPCTRCRNGKRLLDEDVSLHLVKWGMDNTYTFWCWHGERSSAFVPEQLPTQVNVQVEDRSAARPMINDFIDDAYGVNNFIANQSMSDERWKQVDADVTQDEEYLRLKQFASKPLYPNCNKDHTTLYAMIGLQNLKSQFGLSGLSVTALLLWAKDLLPIDNSLPTSYPTMKSTLKGLGMKYKSVHACKYDCILYRNEYESSDKCPVCSEPRFFLKKNTDKRGIRMHKAPQKVLKYFPLGPRLKRLYTIPWISEAMTWHARAEERGNLMRHPFDSTTWKSTNIAYPDFAKEARNVCLGLATDGFKALIKVFGR